ncbi:hypothetical protein I41_24260 [Lacipirellula limnantheis]|uniref:Uncharacterized protein n=1 Tax=Lacipirellula limnantheis TaxID=2528024 RepID=A0A517TXZ5_9BACT|nr:hypothetical protein I41_24260 [Lacipirellula limnantheis]
MSPKMDQSIARHSDVNLTLNVYSHVGIGEQAAAIQSLPGPPLLIGSGESQSAEVAAGKFAHGFAQTPDSARQSVSSIGMAASP